MRRFLMLGTLLLMCGCRNVVGPLQPKPPQRVDDPLLTISEQERNGRASLPLPDESAKLTPQTGGLGLPGTYNRNNFGR
jgi:hypothetical protein